MSSYYKAKVHDNFLLQISYFIIKYTLGFLVKIIWIKEVNGVEGIPKNGPVIIAFNHQSYFDFLSFVSISPRKIHFLAAEKFFSHILWGPLVKLMSQIKVDRENSDKEDLHRLIYEHLSNNKVIGIFPEGTRSPYETEMLKAFTGVAEFALRGNVPVVPVGIKGAYEIMSKHDKFPKFKKIISIYVGQPMYFNEYDHSKMNKKTFRLVTNKIMSAIAGLSGRNYPYLHIEE